MHAFIHAYLSNVSIRKWCTAVTLSLFIAYRSHQS